ncbi:uncharacterized protein F4812DRAFT_444203 [Daldinia caldariorum]|uniref:uncharacterized protein n=1 Tax=Daldinia caldariorum TaxID=326644 RepID=UPI002008E33A|nr:uncharacterized protein F4812DRAFT_444203 [Daldinia caldariorum]KAI1464013.1 hypothetical protein F4812DRAFT_444203 [Daldinia caldariorum]
MGSLVDSNHQSNASSGKDFLQTGSVLIGLDTIAVLLRIWVRISQREHLKGHDYLCILSLLIFVVQSGLIFNFIVKYGVFDFGPPLGEAEMIEILRISWICEFTFGGVITTVKLSILWFFYSIFSVNKTFQKTTYIAAALCILWFIITTFIILFQCDPIDAFWNQLNSPLFCINSTHFLLGHETANLLLDVLILCMPLGMLSQLKLSLSRKISLWIIFILAGLVCVASIIRLRAIYPLPNPTKDFNFGLLILWAEIQSGLAIVCACLPTLGPLVKYMPKIRNKVRNWLGLSSVRASRSGGVSGQQPKTSDTSNTARGWPQAEEQRYPHYTRASGSWIRVDENASETFPLKPTKTQNDSSASQNLERS